jgi:hypothetical protein
MEVTVACLHRRIGSHTYRPVMALDPSPSGDDTIRELMWVVRPTDTHLGPASDGDGYRPLARDDETNAIETHVKLHTYDEDPDNGPSLQTLVIRGLAVVGVALAAKELAPHAQRLWNGHAWPALQSTWGKITGTVGEDSAPNREEPAAIEVVPVAAPEEGVVMSLTEARERFIAAVMARAYSDEEVRVLREARIVDGEQAAELERALASLTPEQLEEGIRLMLGNGPPEELRHLLGLRSEDGEPLRLRLTDGQS